MKALTIMCVIGFLSIVILFSACAKTGACVSSAVEYTYGLRVYCYDDWSADECADNDAQNVNGASWTHYPGDTFADRGLEEGSNPWP